MITRFKITEDDKIEKFIQAAIKEAADAGFEIDRDKTSLPPCWNGQGDWPEILIDGVNAENKLDAMELIQEICNDCRLPEKQSWKYKSVKFPALACHPGFQFVEDFGSEINEKPATFLQVSLNFETE